MYILEKEGLFITLPSLGNTDEKYRVRIQMAGRICKGI